VFGFDNCQEVLAFPEIPLRELSRIPDGVNFMVLNRRDPPKSLIRLRDLELRSREMTRGLHSESDGRAAGLDLMVQKAKKDMGNSRALKTQSSACGGKKEGRPLRKALRMQG
jgi:hypothetical protein